MAPESAITVERNSLSLKAVEEMVAKERKKEEVIRKKESLLMKSTLESLSEIIVGLKNDQAVISAKHESLALAVTPHEKKLKISTSPPSIKLAEKENVEEKAETVINEVFILREKLKTLEAKLIGNKTNFNNDVDCNNSKNYGNNNCGNNSCNNYGNNNVGYNSCNNYGNNNICCKSCNNYGNNNVGHNSCNNYGNNNVGYNSCNNYGNNNVGYNSCNPSTVNFTSTHKGSSLSLLLAYSDLIDSLKK
jgi:hypothetical protein